MGTRKSRHNKGRKPLYKEHRENLAETDAPHPITGKWDARMIARGIISAPPAITLDRPRYGGSWMATGTWWTEPEKAALESFIAAGAPLEKAADALGRAPESLISRARDLGIPLREAPPEWRGPKGIEAFIRKQERVTARNINKAARAARKQEDIAFREAQYPYIIRPRDEHARLLEVSALVPRGLPDHVRADICQEVMLAMFEGRVTIEELRRMKDKMRWFVTKFYRDNMEDGGRALSLTGRDDDDRSYDEVVSGIAMREWDWTQMNDKRSAHDSISMRVTAPTQIDDVYASQVRRHQGRHHLENRLLDFTESEADLATA